MKQLLITIAALVLVGCADPEVEANKLFTAASQLVQNADEIAEPYSVKAYNNRKTAIELIEKYYISYFNNDITSYSILSNSTPDKLEKEFPAIPGFLKPRLPTRKRGQKKKEELTIEDFKF